MTKPSILTCRVPEAFRSCLTDWVGESYDFIWTDSDEEANECLQASEPTALLLAPEPQPSEDNVLRTAYLTRSDLPIALVAPTSESRTFAAMQAYGVLAALPPTPHLSAGQVSLFLQHLTETGSNRGLARFVEPERPLTQRRFREHNERLRLLQSIKDDFEKCPYADTYDLQLVFEEFLNNAVRHAFRTGHDLPKYSATQETIEEEDEILIEWTNCPDASPCCERGALAISDSQGALAAQTVWEPMFRQTGMAGLLDTSGRGFYLVHLLSSFMAITIQPGIRTEVVAFFSPCKANKERPISIRIVTD